MQAMNQIDLPDGKALRPLPASVTYGAMIDIRNVEHEITDFMIRRACEEMDAQQQYPFCGRQPKKRRS